MAHMQGQVRQNAVQELIVSHTTCIRDLREHDEQQPAEGRRTRSLRTGLVSAGHTTVKDGDHGRSVQAVNRDQEILRSDLSTVVVRSNSPLRT